jgi:hypothetical protein
LQPLCAAAPVSAHGGSPGLHSQHGDARGSGHEHGSGGLLFHRIWSAYMMVVADLAILHLVVAANRGGMHDCR